MTAIRMDTDELIRLARRMEREISEPLLCTRRRVEGLSDWMRMDRLAGEEFLRMSTPILRNAIASFGPPASHLQSARERLSIAVKYFEEVDNASVGRQAALRAGVPDWFWSRDFALCLMMDMTVEELAVFFPYGNLLGGNPKDAISLLLSTVEKEIPDIAPGSAAARAFLEQLTIQKYTKGSWEAELFISLVHPYNIQAGTPNAAFYLIARDPIDIVPGSTEEDLYVRCVEEAYSVRLEGNWPKGLRLMAASGVHDVGQKLGAEMTKSGFQAFREVYGAGPNDHLYIIWGTTTTAGAIAEGNHIGDVGRTIGAGGFTTNKHLINFATISNLSSNWQVDHYSTEDRKKWESMFRNGRNTTVHELGHAFCNIWITPVKNPDGTLSFPWLPGKPDKVIEAEEASFRRILMSDAGYYGHQPGSRYISEWRQHPLKPEEAPNLYGEAFADMFLGWTYDTWEEPGMADPDGVGQIRRDYMGSKMPAWLKEAKARPWLSENSIE